MKEEESKNKVVRNPGECSWCLDNAERIGVATGNWGCGAFGGDPELKAIIQWLAASQVIDFADLMMEKMIIIRMP